MINVYKNLEDYVKIYPKFLDHDYCQDTINQLKKVEWSEHKFYDPSSNNIFNHDTEPDVCYEHIPNKNFINKKIWSILEKYILIDFKNYHSWFGGWSGYSEIRFNRYTCNSEMKEHCDHIHSLFDGERKGIPILSIVGLLNDDYQGGDFIMWGSKKINLKTGDVLVFPSNFLFPHRISPINNGIRYSFVSWAW